MSVISVPKAQEEEETAEIKIGAVNAVPASEDPFEAEDFE